MQLLLGCACACKQQESTFLLFACRLCCVSAQVENIKKDGDIDEDPFFYGWNSEHKLAWRVPATDNNIERAEFASFLVMPDDVAKTDFMLAEWEDGKIHEVPQLTVEQYEAMEKKPEQKNNNKPAQKKKKKDELTLEKDELTLEKDELTIEKDQSSEPAGSSPSGPIN